jgi:hypothetical protein
MQFYVFDFKRSIISSRNYHANFTQHFPALASLQPSRSASAPGMTVRRAAGRRNEDASSHQIPLTVITEENEMKKMWQSILSLAPIVLLGPGVAMAADYAKGDFIRESIEVSDQHVFNTDTEVNGVTIHIRDFRNDVVTATVSTGALEPDWAYSIWWVVFNNPQYCATPGECTAGDLEVNGGDPLVKASVFWAGGLLADGSGSAETELKLVPGRTKRELFAMSKNWGLRNIRRAEIHLVLRSHGLAGIAGPVSKQVGTANEACPVSGCANVFASVHRR